MPQRQHHGCGSPISCRTRLQPGRNWCRRPLLPHASMGHPQLPQSRQRDELPLQHALWRRRSTLSLLPTATGCTLWTERILRLRPLPHLRRCAHATASRRGRHSRRLTPHHFPYWRWQIAHLPIAGTNGRTQLPRSHRGHLTAAVAHERPSRQPCRPRHSRCRHHQRTPRPRRTCLCHYSGVRRHCQPPLYCPRNAAVQNHRTPAPWSQRSEVCN